MEDRSGNGIDLVNRSPVNFRYVHRARLIELDVTRGGKPRNYIADVGPGDAVVLFDGPLVAKVTATAHVEIAIRSELEAIGKQETTAARLNEMSYKDTGRGVLI